VVVVVWEPAGTIPEPAVAGIGTGFARDLGRPFGAAAVVLVVAVVAP
jgi:hypothetical protein